MLPDIVVMGDEDGPILWMPREEYEAQKTLRAKQANDILRRMLEKATLCVRYKAWPYSNIHEPSIATVYEARH